jgi:hypothetical protein
MAGKYFVCANQDLGAVWPFSRDQIAQVIAEVRPDATVSGPFEANDTFEVQLPGETRRGHEVIYHSATMLFSFREEDRIDVTAGFVLQFLQGLAPEVPALWVADFVGETHPFRPIDINENEFVRQIRTET